MIPVSEIENIVKILEDAAEVCENNHNWNKAGAYNAAIYLLKELLPK